MVILTLAAILWTITTLIKTAIKTLIIMRIPAVHQDQHQLLVLFTLLKAILVEVEVTITHILTTDIAHLAYRPAIRPEMHHPIALPPVQVATDPVPSLLLLGSLKALTLTLMRIQSTLPIFPISMAQGTVNREVREEGTLLTTWEGARVGDE